MDDGKGRPVSPRQSQNCLQPAQEGLALRQLGGAVRFVPQEIKDYLVTNRGLTAHRLRQVVRKGVVR